MLNGAALVGIEGLEIGPSHGSEIALRLPARFNHVSCFVRKIPPSFGTRLARAPGPNVGFGFTKPPLAGMLGDGSDAPETEIQPSSLPSVAPPWSSCAAWVDRDWRPARLDPSPALQFLPRLCRRS